MDYLGALATSVVGAFVGAYFAMHFQVKKNLKEQCYSAFVRFHVAISSVTYEWAHLTGGDAWHDAYIEKRKVMEQAADELITLTSLTISPQLAKQVGEVRGAFRVLNAPYMTMKQPEMPGGILIEANEALNKTQPREILTKLEGLTLEYRRALGVRFSRPSPSAPTPP
jgi:hypothetical protein